MSSRSHASTAAERPVVVVVDAYVSGKYLAQELRSLGADVVHLRGTAKWIGTMPRPDLSSYVYCDVFDTTEETVKRLKALRPIALLAGQEPGVELADRLAESLGLSGNGTSRSSARRDKHAMIETLRTAGLKTPRQFVHRDPDALRAWAERELAEGAVVVKPTRSAASDNVYVCKELAEVENAVDVVQRSRTVYGEPNEGVLLQECLIGDEFVVDMVSGPGGRYVCGVWRYRKRLLESGRNVYDREDLVDPDSDEVVQLVDYVGRALDALEVTTGPSHAEVILTADGPALVEIGTRMAGNMHPRFHDLTAGANQATVSAIGILDSERFAAEYAGRRYVKHRAAMCCTTSTQHGGIVTGIDETVLAELNSLPGVFRVDLKLAAGDRIRPTVDLYSSTMRIFVHGDVESDLDSCYERIEALKEGVFRVVSDDGVDAKLDSGRNVS